MNIAVISPHSRNNGTTTIAGFLALELACRGKKTCLTHVSTKSPSLLKYFGLDEAEEDKTANPSRMVKMIREGILKREDITEYCRPINKTMEIYSANDANFKDEDMLFALEFMVKNFPHDFVVFDIDNNNLDSDATKLVLGNCEFIVVVMEQSAKEAIEFKRLFRSIWKSIGKKPMLMVVNKYNTKIGKANDIALELGIKEIKKTSSWLYLHYNPYIVKYENKGNLQGLHKAMRTNDARIFEISSDVKNIVNRIMKYRSVKRMGKMDTKSKQSDEESTVEENTESTPVEEVSEE